MKNKKLYIYLIIAFIVMMITILIPKESKAVTDGQMVLPEGKYVIRAGTDTSKALDVEWQSKNNEANISIFKYDGWAHQQFNLTYCGGGYYTISASHSGKMLDVYAALKERGTNVQQFAANGGDNQKWKIVSIGDGFYSVISKCNGLYLDIYGGYSANGTNVQVFSDEHQSKSQKFKFERVDGGSTEVPTVPETPQTPVDNGTKTIEDGNYTIVAGTSDKMVLSVAGQSTNNEANIELDYNSNLKSQQFNIKYDGNGYYTISPLHSGKMVDVYASLKTRGTNVQQFAANNADNQKWKIVDIGNGYYSIISKCNGLFLDIYGGYSAKGTNIQVFSDEHQSKSQKFKFVAAGSMGTTGAEPTPTPTPTTPVQTFTYKSYKSKYLKDYTGSLDETKYPGYTEAINNLLKAHPNWKIKLLVIGRDFTEITSGECKVHSRNLVPSSTSGEWVCPTCGTKLYDSGWYCASEKAVAYYMDPRNFLNEKDIFQFMDINTYVEGAYPTSKIQEEVNGTFLEPYAEDITTACRNQGVNPLFVIARLFQENGRSGSSTTRGLKDSDGKVYYNPFNIGASGNGVSQILANALAKAKSYGWDTMEKAIEGGIMFCKANWLENCQNTLYLNKFDIDDTNGSSLYSHQYMQNLMAAYSEGRSMYSMIKDVNSVNSGHTFIIPVYENINAEISVVPNDNIETFLMNVEVTGSDVRFRSGASTNSDIIEELAKGTVLLSMQRGINSDWQYVVKPDGTAGYVSGAYLKQVDDVTTCNIKMKVKTNDGAGVNVRLGPGTNYGRVTSIADNTEVTVIDNTTYSNLDGNKWFRVILSDGKQSFVSGNYLVNVE